MERLPSGLRTHSSTLWLAGGAAFLVVAVFAGALVGPVHLGVVDVVRGTFAHAFGLHSPLSRTNDAILWEIRLPRVVLGAIVGATLAAAGAAYQGVFRNPLADPYLLGVAAGGGLGATAIIVSGGSSEWLPVAAFAGAVVAVTVTYLLGATARWDTGAGTTAVGNISIVLAGVAVAVPRPRARTHPTTTSSM